MGRRYKSLWGLAFFGLTSSSQAEARNALFSLLHYISFYSEGAYSWDLVYNMPIWLRNLTYKKLDEYYTKKKPTDPNKIDFENPDKSKLPKINVPSYITKASRK